MTFPFLNGRFCHGQVWGDPLPFRFSVPSQNLTGGPHGAVADGEEHAWVCRLEANAPFKFDERERQSCAVSASGRFALQGDAASFSYPILCAIGNAVSDFLEIGILCHQNAFVEFRNHRHDLISGVLRQNLRQNDHFVAPFSENGADRCRYAMIQQKFHGAY